MKECKSFDKKSVWLNDAYDTENPNHSADMAMGLMLVIGELALHSPKPLYVRSGFIESLRPKTLSSSADLFTSKELANFSQAPYVPVPMRTVKSVGNSLKRVNPAYHEYIDFKINSHRQIVHAYNRAKNLPAKTEEACSARTNYSFTKWKTEHVAQYKHWSNCNKQLRLPKRSFTNSTLRLKKQYAQMLQAAYEENL